MPSALWSASTLKAHLGSTRFMKVARILHEEERDLVVKIFVKPDKLEDDVIQKVWNFLDFLKLDLARSILSSIYEKFEKFKLVL